MYLRIILEGHKYNFKCEDNQQVTRVIKEIAAAENGTRVIEIEAENITIFLKTSKIISIEVTNNSNDLNVINLDFYDFHIRESIMW
jgi:hypothetical protein